MARRFYDGLSQRLGRAFGWLSTIPFAFHIPVVPDEADDL